MNEQQLDEVYTETCNAVTAAGEANSELFLARLTLLLMKELDDPARIRAAITAAREDLPAA